MVPLPSELNTAYGNILTQILQMMGERLDSSNVTIDWKNDYEATITLRSKESVPEVVEFNISNKSNGSVFKKVQKVVSSFTFQKSESPSLINIIELRETIKSKGPSPSSTVRIYYGERGSILKNIKRLLLRKCIRQRTSISIGETMNKYR